MKELAGGLLCRFLVHCSPSLRLLGHQLHFFHCDFYSMMQNGIKGLCPDCRLTFKAKEERNRKDQDAPMKVKSNLKVYWWIVGSLRSLESTHCSKK